ncbi:hypothetical protein PENSPDRAFT_47312 [Peniophora sp. CONT]|nr:hypothetical protein PENSPDRAFT_47312 [Peniophora sp. CONT]
MKRYPTSLPRHAASSTKSSPDATRIIKAAQKLSRLFRTKRLTTRSSVDLAVLRQLSLMQDRDHIFHPALREPAVLEKVYEESKLLDLYHDMILEDNFFSEPQVYISTVLTGIGMAAMHATSYQFHQIADRMVHRAPSMWKHLWANRRFLLNNPALSSPPPEKGEPFISPAAVVTYPADLTADQIRPASESQTLSSGSSDRLVLIMLMYGSAGLRKIRKDVTVSPYHRYVALFYWVCMTSHIDASTPQGDTLRPVLTCLQGIEADSRARDALVREVFAEGSGVEPAAFCMRINQHARRVGVTFNVAVPKEEDQAGFQILNAALDIACHPSILPSVAKHHCHEVYAGIMGHVMRTGVLTDAHAEYALWYTCRMFSQWVDDRLSWCTVISADFVRAGRSCTTSQPRARITTPESCAP